MRKKDQDTVESDGRNGVNSEVGATKLCTECRLWILRDTWTRLILLRGHVSYNAGAQLKRHSLFSPCALNDTPCDCWSEPGSHVLSLLFTQSVDIPQSLLGGQPGTVPGPGAKQQLGSFRKEKALKL